MKPTDIHDAYERALRRQHEAKPPGAGVPTTEQMVEMVKKLLPEAIATALRRAQGRLDEEGNW